MADPFEINEDYVTEIIRRPYPMWVVKQNDGSYHVGVPDLGCDAISPTWAEIPSTIRNAMIARVRDMIQYREVIVDPSTITEGRLLTPSEIAYRFRISNKTVYNAIRDGKLKPVDLPAHRIVITEREAGEWRRKTKKGRPIKAPDLYKTANDYFLRGEWGLLKKMLEGQIPWRLRKKITQFLKHEAVR